MKAIASVDTVRFRIDVDFPKADVDMVYKEMCARRVTTNVPIVLTDHTQIPVDKSKLKDTPSEASVDFCLHWLAGFVDRNEMCIQDSKWDKDFTKPITAKTEDGMEYSTFEATTTELEELGIEVPEWYGLMMGTCHLICEIDANQYCQELVQEATRRVQDVFDRFLVYYDQDDE